MTYQTLEESSAKKDRTRKRRRKKKRKKKKAKERNSKRRMAPSNQMRSFGLPLMPPTMYQYRLNTRFLGQNSGITGALPYGYSSPLNEPWKAAFHARHTGNYDSGGICDLLETDKYPGQQGFALGLDWLSSRLYAASHMGKWMEFNNRED